MGVVVDFPIHRHFSRIQCVRVDKLDETGEIIIDIRALGIFSPYRVNPMAIIKVQRPDGSLFSITGSLYYLPDDPCGTHYRFAFRPNGRFSTPVVFTGLNRFSNVKAVVLRIGSSVQRFTNRFARIA